MGRQKIYRILHQRAAERPEAGVCDVAQQWGLKAGFYYRQDTFQHLKILEGYLLSRTSP